MDNQKQFEQYITQKRNSVLEIELNARYCKAKYELKYYTLEENKLRESFQQLIVEQQKVVDSINSAMKDIEREAQPEVIHDEAQPKYHPEEDQEEGQLETLLNESKITE